ncbi:Na+/H+ antiporter family protein [Halomonas elongata]|uniref:Na+/H+ antiporter NhaC family protein n=1 Tax=Halomonas elongata (strain ATCC 33173 / DSM 2581 / NBRC 15536 / NCIMB 2198 / 1H9) TaxID=768066 RepID=E1VCK3_HALED|nr:Na+/H+ antiporter NhaC family protein [Halomonas elongata]MBW5799084.1 TRAP transporter large permease subunit [Halomonas elongata]RAW08902.1 sodium:proton antiporter [Halomonas elongata]WPU48506.1 Na+/H+ antiporter NhaC family protein [Halomonas elongata DSM 2581]WVI73072.1 Na+/H+ antiporter NhaC family protein [Halomonas elongata]CBV42358.1 NhaC family sodium/proton antiporter domain protein [Halomonas elongata DSM 2581]
MNAVVLAILVMVTLSLMRVSVVFALIAAALVGGLYAGMPLGEILSAFNDGLGNGAKVAISYAVLGAFAVALSRSGITQLLSNKAIARLGLDDGIPNRQLIVFTLLGVLLAAAVSSQNLIPVHIAFIPVLVPPLLKLMNHLQLDRRAVACVITFGITAPYMLLPVGFGSIFLHDILLTNLNENGLDVTAGMVPMAMIVPIGGMALGLVVALLFSYRRKRSYQDIDLAHGDETPSQAAQHLKPWQMVVLAVALVGTVTVQLFTGSMVIGGLFGFALLSVSGVFRWHEQDDIFTEGMRMMALVGFIMISAAGFASVMQASGEVEALVTSSTEMIGDNKGLAALIMLLVGLFITMGIGSSFSTIPIIASLYVPLALNFGFSPMATIALVGAAAALGDAGSPASDSTLGPTAGLNADGQHDHIWDSVVPTFLHYNIPLVAFGWIAAMTL